MTTEQEKVLARVRKMLALANDAGASEGERDNAMRMAHATLAKYNLDLAACTPKEPSTGQAATEKREEIRANFFGRPWARRAVHACADLLFCSYLSTPATKGKDTTHYFVGSYANATTAALLAEYVVKSIYKEGKRQQRATGNGNAYFISFAWGAANALSARVHEIKEKSKQQKPEGPIKVENALIVLGDLYKTEDEANRKFIAQLYPNLTRTRSGLGARDSSGYSQGQAYGRSINLDRQVK